MMRGRGNVPRILPYLEDPFNICFIPEASSILVLPEFWLFGNFLSSENETNIFAKKKNLHFFLKLVQGGFLSHMSDTKTSICFILSHEYIATPFLTGASAANFILGILVDETGPSDWVRMSDLFIKLAKSCGLFLLH